MAKILIIRLSSFGDVVLTTPVIRCLKNQYPGGVEIHFLVKRKFYDVIKANPHISKFHILEKEFGEVIKELKNENFDFIIDLHNNIRSLFVKYMLWIKSYSLNKINIRKWLLVNLKINFLPATHIVDRCFKTVEPLGIENDGLGLDYFIPREDEIEISAFPHAFQNGFIVFAIGGNYNTKKLPVQKISSICQKIKRPIILLGGKEDFENGEMIYAENKDHCFNMCGKLNINQSASVIRQSKKVITHDTGMMHIAAAFKKEIISVWGNTIPEFGMYPYFGDLFSGSKGKIFQVQNLSCRPCSKLGFKSCPKGHFNCMNKHPEQDIAQEASF